ncbi:Plug domain-containing protein [Pseudoxanthomonas dokdonensis]|nr:Plug domain-containing protein [Pseudoxanthomonas dokdonensis]
MNIFPKPRLMAWLAAGWLALASFGASAGPVPLDLLSQQQLDELPESVRNMTLRQIADLVASSPADGGNSIPALRGLDVSRVNGLPASMMDLTLAQLADLQRIIDDPAVEERLSAWMEAYLQELKALGPRIAERGGARNLLLAQLWCDMFEDQGGSDGRPVTRQHCETNGWLDKAEAMRPWDPWVAWYAAGSCDAADAECPSNPQAMLELERQQPDNAAVALLAMAHADDRARRKWLHQAARADRYHNFNQDIVAALYGLSRELTLPDMDADMATYLQYSMLGTDVAEVPRALNISMMMMATVELQAAEHDILWQPVKQACEPLADASGQNRLRRDCIQVASLLADSGQSFIVKKEAAQLRVGLETDRQRRQQWQQQLRQFLWYEAQMQANPTAAGKSRFCDMVLSRGLGAATDDWRASNAIADTAPADWQPADKTEQAMLGDDWPYPGASQSAP